MTQVLEGFRVLDFTQGMAGPLTTMILGDYGAEVIRVEPPGGDPMWSHPAYLLWNRGKKSIELDFDAPETAAQLEALIASADVLIESLRPGEADALGFGYEKAHAINPALVYHSISAFGKEGPLKNLKAFDGIVNARSGRMRDQVGHYRMRPNFRAVNDTSYHTAMFSTQSILAALRIVQMTGKGQHTETSLLKGVTAPNNPWRRFEGEELGRDLYPGETETADHLKGELVADRRETDPNGAIPSQLCTETKDGRWIMHAHVQYGLFRAWIKTIGFDWIWDDERYKGAPTQYPSDQDRIDLNNLIIARMKEKTAQEWIDLYIENPDCAGEIMETTQEAIRHPQFIINGHQITIEDPRVGTITEVGPFVKLSETPAVITTPAPSPGQHTAEVLSSITPRVAKTPTGGDPKRPLEGVVMLEMATWLAAPFSGALLADLGARVIKIEPPAGDPFRTMVTNENMIRATQGKESIAIDLKSTEGQAILHRLIEHADVLMHNFRPGAPPRLAVDYETVKAINPGIVYLYAGSYGSTGPNSRRAAFNPTMGALGGNSVFQSGEGNIPIGDQSPDPISGSGVGTGIMLGLAARWFTGVGQYCETTMMNSVVYCNSDDALDYENKPPRRNPDKLQLGLEATYRLYETAEGWIMLAVQYDADFARFAELIGRPELASDERFSSWDQRYANRVALGEILEEVFKTDTAPEWERRLQEADLGCVQADATGHKRFLHLDPQTEATHFMVPTKHWAYADRAPDGKYWRHAPVVDFSETPCEAGKPFVAFAEDTVSIMTELGYSESEIAKLKEAKVITWDENAPTS